MIGSPRSRRNICGAFSSDTLGKHGFGVVPIGMAPLSMTPTPPSRAGRTEVDHRGTLPNFLVRFAVEPAMHPERHGVHSIRANSRYNSHRNVAGRQEI